MKKLVSTLTVLVSGLFSLQASAAPVKKVDLVNVDEGKLNQLSEDEAAYRELLKNIKPGRFNAIDDAGSADHSRGG